MIRKRIQVHGHRGARARRPENTLAAFRYAIDLGVDAVELDVLVTRDDVPVVVHDPYIGPEDAHAIRSLTLVELGEYDCGAMPRERVPTLDQVFALGRGNHVWFNVEAKSFPDHPELAPVPDSCAAMILARVRKHGLSRRVILQSFDPRVLTAAAKQEPGIPRSALWESDLDWAGIAKEFSATMLSPLHALVSPERVAWAHAAGLPVLAWTVNEPEQWAPLAEAGIDGMITDDPAALIAWLTARGLR